MPLQPNPPSSVKKHSKLTSNKLTYESAAGDNREIPVEEGGSVGTDGWPTKGRDLESVSGPGWAGG